MKYAIIENGIVTNVIMLDDTNDYTPAVGALLVKIEDGEAVGTGFTYDGTTFVDPNPPQAIVFDPTTPAS